jgi:hypothetical protein
LRYDIRALTTDELEAELEARLSKRDVVPIEDCPSIEEEGALLPDFSKTTNEKHAFVVFP